jgi:hypothetical protein
MVVPGALSWSAAQRPDVPEPESRGIGGYQIADDFQNRFGAAPKATGNLRKV